MTDDHNITLKKAMLATSAVIVMASILMAFLAIGPHGLENRYAFASIVGLLLANTVVGLGRLGIHP